MDLTNEEKVIICAALEQEIPRREELVNWASGLPDTDADKENLLTTTKWQLTAAQTAYAKLKF